MGGENEIVPGRKTAPSIKLMETHDPDPQINYSSLRKTKPLSRCDNYYDNTCPGGQEDTLEKQPNSS